MAPKTRKHFVREGGVIDENIQRLISTEKMEKDKGIYEFVPEEFDIIAEGVDSDVEQLLEDFKDSQNCDMSW